jgi:hypothetical protein
VCLPTCHGLYDHGGGKRCEEDGSLRGVCAKSGGYSSVGFFGGGGFFSESYPKHLAVSAMRRVWLSAREPSENGPVGASCYQRFAESLQEALVESQKGLVHRGKRPARNQAGEEELAAEMKQLIAQEDFEGAARLRDQIAAKKKSAPRRRRSS